MIGLSTIASTIGLANDMKKSISYWKNFKNEQIRVVNVDFTKFEDGSHGRIKSGIQGTVSSVQSLPPGFVLKNAFEYYNPEPFAKGEYGVPEDGGSYPDQHYEEIFVSFNNIDRIDFIEDQGD